ncbi:MAG: flagellar biosynthesis anti-sigma factor FlgM [Herminiimonas sp.]|nr:flagellar biosynthesis anti-sigma factor FlgM [Herminiimonas sp.]
MKIDDAAKKSPGLGVVANQGRTTRSTEKTGVAKTSTDTVSLSSQSQALAGVSNDSAVFDVSKVQEIKDAIASGRFQVDAGKVADGLIDTVKDLIRPSRG